MTVLEKLLVPDLARRVVEQGYDALTGPVYRPEDLLGLSPAERVAAHGLEGADGPFGGDPEHVDIVRFTTNPLMDLRTPTPVPDAPARDWPTYDTGFLLNAAPVWWLTMTRVPVGARFVRVGRDGRESEFSRYDGAARGWRGAKGYFPPLHLIGPRVRWHGLDLPASYVEDQQALEAVWVGDRDVPEGFVATRPRVHARVVPLTECDEVFEIVIAATWRGQHVRVLQQAGEEALLVLTSPSDAAVQELGTVELEPGVHQVTAPAVELEDLIGVRSDPAPLQPTPPR